MNYARRSPSPQSPYGTIPRGQPGGPSSFAGGGSSSHTAPPHPPHEPQPVLQFDMIKWYPRYQGCLQYFVECAQYDYPCQALAAFINIRLPFQRDRAFPPPLPPSIPIAGPSAAMPPYHQGYAPNPTASAAAMGNALQSNHGWVSLHPYIRRLVATGFDAPSILECWFGEDWKLGVGPLHEQERRNYLFAAKSGGWSAVKRDYDKVLDEAVPYLKPLSRVEYGEIEGAEEIWSQWLAMEDWMLGDRAPPDEDEGI